MSLWFVTPAYQRYEMTALCLEQRSRVIAELAKHGIEAHQVVTADDDNLNIAESLGAATVVSANFGEDGTPLVGRKFNDGMAYAGEQGAEWIVPIGSDSWIDPAYFVPLLSPGETLTSTAYVPVRPDRMAVLRVAPQKLEWSAGPYVFHRSQLEPSGFRPSENDSLMVDTSTIAGIEATAGPIEWVERTVHPFQYVGFRVMPMMSSYNSLRRRWLVREIRHNGWRYLYRYYAADLVQRAKDIMAHQDYSQATYITQNIA